MSDAQTYEEVAVSSDGVTVTKRFEADEFPVPAIAFQVRSKRDEPVTIRLVDTVPDDVAVEDLGFHPEYGSEHWEINEDEIAFEKELDPDSEYTTVYGIRATGTDNVETFLTEPTIESVDPPLDDPEADIVGSTDNAVKDVIAGDADSVPGLEHDDDEEIETLELKDPKGTAHQSAEGDDAADTDDESATGEAAAAAGSVDGNVMAAMANEIRNQNVTKEDVTMLKRALDAVSEDDGASGATDARVKRIQSDVADLRAYTDALEEFLDENGTGDEMIQEFRDRLESFEHRLADFEGDIEQTAATAEDAAATAEAMDERIGSVEGDVDDVEGHIESLDGSLDDLEAEIEDVREELGDGELDARLSDVEEAIDELESWREQLSSVIGGGTGGSDE